MSAAENEKKLYVNLPTIIGDIVIKDVIHLGEAHSNPPHNIEALGLVALMPDEPSGGSLDPTGRAYNWPASLKPLPPAARPPSIEAKVGIGLIFDPDNETDSQPELHAVSSAGIKGDALRVVQLQGAVRIKNNLKMRKRSGLHQGVLWRDTLVQAWTEVAKALELDTIELKGTKFKKSQLSPGRQDVYSRYDEVALRMGFTEPDTLPGYWTRPTSVK